MTTKCTMRFPTGHAANNTNADGTVRHSRLAKVKADEHVKAIEPVKIDAADIINDGKGWVIEAKGAGPRVSWFYE